MIKNNLKKKIKNKKIGLALGGGGARGLSHIGFLKVFDELGIKPSVMSGTSIGSVIGGLYCMGLSAADIEQEFRNINYLDLGSLIDINIRAQYGLIKGDKIAKLLKDITKGMDFDLLNIPLKVVATSYWEGKEIVLEKGPVFKAVRASISIPGIFEPEENMGKILVDGSHVNPVPYDLLKNECDLIIAVDVTGVRISEDKHNKKPNVFENILAAYQISQESIIKNKIALFPPDIYLNPELNNINPLEFHKIDDILQETESESVKLKGILKQLKK